MENGSILSNYGRRSISVNTSAMQRLLPLKLLADSDENCSQTSRRGGLQFGCRTLGFSKFLLVVVVRWARWDR